MVNISTETATGPELAASAAKVDSTPPEDPAAGEAAPIIAVEPTVRIRKNDFVSIFTNISD